MFGTGRWGPGARALLLLAVLAAGAAVAPAGAQQPPAAVLADRARMVEISETTPVIGQLVATTESAVATRTAGIVRAVLFRVGDRVERGQELVQLDDDLIAISRRSAAAALEVARAGVEVAEARLRLAAQAYERQAQLRGSTAFSKGQFEDLAQTAEQARSELSRARAQVHQAEAELARADYDLGNATIRAPFAGVVVARAAQPGSYIALGQPVATLLDVAALEIEMDLPVRLIGGLAEGTEVEAVFDPGVRVTARVRSLLPVESVSTRTRPVRLGFDLSAIDPARLAEGKSLILEVPVEAPRQALMVPKDALVQAGEASWTVFTVENGKAVRRPVSLGQSDGTLIEITSGLLPGEAVVVRGNERLRPGQAVAPEFVEGAAPALAAGADGRS